MRVDVGEEVFFEADEEYSVKFEPFAVMERHHFDQRDGGIGFDVGAEREFFEELRKSWVGMLYFPFSGFCQEFVEVFFPILERVGIVF